MLQGVVEDERSQSKLGKSDMLRVDNNHKQLLLVLFSNIQVIVLSLAGKYKVKMKPKMLKVI